MAYSKELEAVIEAALADGVLTDKERAVLHKKAQQEGIDPDELDVVIEGRLAKMKREEDWLRPTPPATEKQGNIVKCPNCGEPVPGGAAVCPACGHEFRNVGSSSAFSAFSEGLNKIVARQNADTSANPLKAVGKKYATILSQGPDRSSEIYTYISSYPVPNTSEDLLQFLSSIQPKAHKTGEHDEADGYWVLYSNCINKAKLNFANDSRFTQYFDFYKKNTKKMSTSKKSSIVLLAFLVVLFSVFFLLIKYSVDSENEDKEIIKQQQIELSERINSLPSPTIENYNDLRNQLLLINWQKKYSSGWQTEDEDAARESFMQAKKTFAIILNSFYMEQHEGQSDPALSEILNLGEKSVSNEGEDN